MVDIRKKCIKIVKPIVERFPKVAKAYRYFRDSRQINEEPKQTPHGFWLTGNKDMEQGIFEQKETTIIIKLLAQADIFINIGANIGYYCCLALSCGKYSIAFEPIQMNLRYLYKNIKANQCENNIEIFPIALSNQVGIVDIYGGGTGASLVKGWEGISAHNVTQVPTSTLDNILVSRFQDKKCLIIIDVEGAEKYVLEGADKFLSRQPKPLWMVEISISEHQPKGTKINPNLSSIFQIFWNNGYEAWAVGEKVRSVGAEEIKAVVETGEDTLFTHNFLFIEKGEYNEIFEILDLL